MGWGYTVAAKVGQKPASTIFRSVRIKMSRPIVLLLVIVLILAGLLYFLSSRAQEVPTRTIEVEVKPATNAS